MTSEAVDRSCMGEDVAEVVAAETVHLRVLRDHLVVDLENSNVLGKWDLVLFVFA